MHVFLCYPARMSIEPSEGYCTVKAVLPVMITIACSDDRPAEPQNLSILPAALTVVLVSRQEFASVKIGSNISSM